MGFLSWWFGEDKSTSKEKEPDKATTRRYRRSLEEERQKYDLDKLQVPSSSVQDMDLEIEVSEPKKFRKVPKWTHAAKDGTEIFCPKCSKTTRVYSFSWTMRGCRHCKERVKKYDWLIEV